MTDNVEAPAVTANTAAPVETAPVVTTTPTVEAAPVTTTVETPVAEVKTETPVETTILGDALAEPAKEPTAEIKPEEKKDEKVVQSDEPAPTPPVYDPFKLPENVKLDETRVKEFTDILGDLETKSKADHALVQEFGQKAVDFHLKEVQNTANEIVKFYQTAWDKQKTEWKETFLKDPEIGGNRFQTTVNSALNFIRTHGGTPEQQIEFRNLMETSGLGNHPVMIRLLANAGSKMQEPKPLAATNPVPLPKSRVETMYGKKA